MATLISGSALARQQLAAPRQDVPGRQHLRRRLPPIDVCTGWKEGGVLAIAAAGGRPMLGEGPPAPSLSRHGDDHAWHELAVLAVHDMRRRRRLDLVVDGNAIVFDALFRDSLREASGIETVVHEYGVTGLIDRADRIVRRLTVTPRVLPGPDCPGGPQRSAPGRSGRRLVADGGERGVHGTEYLHAPQRRAAFAQRHPPAARATRPRRLKTERADPQHRSGAGDRPATTCWRAVGRDGRGLRPPGRSWLRHPYDRRRCRTRPADLR